MHRTQVPWEAYVRRFEDAFDRYKKGRLTGAILDGVSAVHP